MKKLLLLSSVLWLSAETAAAQNWSDLLTKIGTALADKATEGELTRLAIVGDWNYPCLVYKSPLPRDSCAARVADGA